MAVVALGEKTERKEEEANTPLAQFHATYPRVTGWASWVPFHSRLGPTGPPGRRKDQRMDEESGGTAGARDEAGSA